MRPAADRRKTPCTNSEWAGQVRGEFGPVVAGIVGDAEWLATLPDKLGCYDDDSARLVAAPRRFMSIEYRYGQIAAATTRPDGSPCRAALCQ